MSRFNYPDHGELENLGVRGLDNTRLAFNASVSLNRFSPYQCQVSPERMWIKTPVVEENMTAPELTSLTSRVATLKATPAVTARSATGVEQSEQYLVISGRSIIPLVAGPGCVIETVNRTITGGLTIPDDLRVSALPWVAGRVGSNLAVISSTG